MTLAHPSRLLSDRADVPEIESQLPSQTWPLHRRAGERGTRDPQPNQEQRNDTRTRRRTTRKDSGIRWRAGCLPWAAGVVLVSLAALSAGTPQSEKRRQFAKNSHFILRVKKANRSEAKSALKGCQVRDCARECGWCLFENNAKCLHGHPACDAESWARCPCHYNALRRHCKLEVSE